MKKIKLGLIAFSAFTGIGSAFAFNHAPKRAGQLYYGKGEGSIYSWSTSPGSRACANRGNTSGACTITSTYDVTGAAYNNVLPAGATVIAGAGQLH